MDNGVFASNISATADDKTLRTFFNQFGTVSEFNLQPDKFNENVKICYLKYSSNEGAAKAVRMADRSTEFGEALRVSFKKFVERSPNGIKPVVINRVQSFGRGRGTCHTSPPMPSSIREDVQLKYLDLTLERKFAVEIVELKSLTNIFARPLLLTDKVRANLYGLLEKINEEADKLVVVKNPEVNNFYLAKWTEDNKFYRSKIITKLNDNQFEVCFVDEGTSGDIVSELRVIPEELSDIPCQFIQCTLDCANSQDLIDLILKEGGDSTVYIYVTNSTKVDDKYVVNIYIDDKDICDIYKSKYTKDPRFNKLPQKQDVNMYLFDQEFHNCRLLRTSKESNLITVNMAEKLEINPSKLKPLHSSPIPNDLLIYNDKTEGYFRCVIESYKFVRCQIIYSIFLVDTNKSLETDKDSLMNYDGNELTLPFKVIKGVIEADRMGANFFDGLQTIKFSDYDAKKELYVVEVVQKKVISEELVGEVKSVLLSHIESVNEFYIQFLDSASLECLAVVQDEINNSSYNVVKVSNGRDLVINEVVIAPFQEVNYRAIVVEVNICKNEVLLYFVDFGNSEWISINEVIKAHKSVASKKPLARKCRLSVSVMENKLEEVTALLLDYCDNGESEVQMSIKEVKDDVLTVNLTVKNKSTFEDILKFKKLVSSQSNVSVKDLLIKKIAELEKRISMMEKVSCRK